MKTQDRIGIFLTLLTLSGPLVPNPMRIIRFTLLLLSLCLIQSVSGQGMISRVTFPIDENQTREDLGRAGIDLSHGHGKLDAFFTTEASDHELRYFDKLGIRYTIDIPNMSDHRKTHHHSRGGLLECQDDLNDALVPQNFDLGNIGGFFSLPEVLDQLDAMQFLYPNLISVRKPIGNFKTWENNSIFWVRISDNPEVDEEEPEVLYTSLIHARELVSVSQNIFYMWYLLENYHKNPLIKQILDHTELYFIPVINPDGLNYNVQGYDMPKDSFEIFWRKNMRDNDGNGEFNPEIDGVDLNRNFAESWGYDDIGSSPHPGSSNYRGPGPFSEPETKAIQFFCNSHEFKFALNHHAYGNLLIYPWGYNNQHTNDSTAFVNYAQILTRLNRFVYGLGLETVGYQTNGDSDDWMYDALGIIAMTPEVGDYEDGFYPSRERIIPLCKSTLQMNLIAARVVNSLIDITDESPAFIHTGLNPLNLEFNRYGLLEGEVQITFSALSPYITQVPAPIVFNLTKFEPHQRNLNFVVDESLPYGATVRMEIVCKQGNYSFRDTITKVRADFLIPVKDEGDLSQWDRTDGPSWGLTPSTFKSGPVSIADSPEGLYGPDQNETLLLNEVIDLRDATSAYAQFWAKWDIEDEFDYVVFQASTDGQQWDNLCGERSKLGGVFQPYEEPLYDGKQTQWVLETSDLSAYLGEQIQLRFKIGTDGWVFKDGFYFDNFKVITIKEEITSAVDIDDTAIKAYPNPASQSFTIEMPQLTDATVTVYNSVGQKVYQQNEINTGTHAVHTATWTPGIYKYIVSSDGTPVHNGVISLMH